MTGPARVAHTPVVKVKGNDLAKQWLDALVHASVDRGIGLIGRATLRFLDAGFALSSAKVFTIGAEVELSAPSSGGLIKGVITSVELQQTAAGSTPELVVTVDDKAARLAASVRSRTFLNQTTEQVMRAVCTPNGVTLSIKAGNVQHPYLLQTGSDLAFLDHLAQRSGLVWWVAPDGVLKMVPTGTASGEVGLELGSQVLAFSVRASAAAPDEVEVTGWDAEQQTSVVAKATASGQAPKTPHPAFVKGATGRGQATRGWKSGALVASPPPLNSKEAGTFAESMAAEAAATAVVMTATCLVDAALQPGVRVSVKGAGPAAGEYVLTRVEHVYNGTGFHSRITSGPVRRSSLVDLMGGGAPATDPGYSLTGVVPAIVTNAHNPSKKNLGLVKVKYPAISGNVESSWARVLTLGAGASRGAVFHPEVGDEVLVAFERGDTRRAVVLGGLYSEKARLPTDDTHEGDKVKFRRITSRNGHVLEFSDGSGDTQEHVLISSKRGAHRIRVGNDRFDIEVGNVPVMIKNGAGASIEFTAAGDVVIKGKNVTIESTAGNAKVAARANLDLSGLTLKAEGKSTATFKSGGLGNVESSGPLAIKGAIVAIN